jgi:hypothetical protein
MKAEQLNQPVSEAHSKSNRFPAYFLDLLFVLILPAVCFALDPIIFDDGLAHRPRFNEALQVATYASVALFSAAFFTTYLPLNSRPVQRFLSGSLLAGGLLALLIGIWILPFSIIGLMLLIGALGFIPFGTAWRFWRRLRNMRFEKPISAVDVLAVTLGITVPFVPPVIVHHYGQARFDAIVGGVQSSNSETARGALSDMNDFWFCRSYCQSEVSSLFVGGKIMLAEPEFASLFKSSTGLDYKYYLENPD